MCLYKVTKNAVNKASQNPFSGIWWLASPNDWLMLGASDLVVCNSPDASQDSKPSIEIHYHHRLWYRQVMAIRRENSQKPSYFLRKLQAMIRCRLAFALFASENPRQGAEMVQKSKVEPTNNPIPKEYHLKVAVWYAIINNHVVSYHRLIDPHFVSPGHNLLIYKYI